MLILNYQIYTSLPLFAAHKFLWVYLINVLQLIMHKIDILRSVQKMFTRS